MTKITGLTQDASQKFTIADPNGTGYINFSFYYRPRLQCWFYDIEYESFAMKGCKLVRGPNILCCHQYVIPFGLCVTVSDDYEPMLINDLSSGRVTLFLLTSAEVVEVQTLIGEGYTVK